jgi:galactokinase
MEKFISNEDRIKESIKRKLAGRYQVQEETKETRLEFEQAKANGDIKAMLYHKMGMAKAEQRMEKYKELENANISDIMRQIRDTEVKMQYTEKEYNAREQEVESKLEELKAEYNVKIAHKPLSVVTKLEREYYQKVKELKDTPSLKQLQSEYTDYETLLRDLRTAKADYEDKNADVIKAIRLDKQRQDIEASGLLDE